MEQAGEEREKARERAREEKEREQAGERAREEREREKAGRKGRGRRGWTGGEAGEKLQCVELVQHVEGKGSRQ